MKYRVNHKYTSRELTLTAGQIVELRIDEAAFINVDSPGCLTVVNDEPKPTATKAPRKPRAKKQVTSTKDK